MERSIEVLLEQAAAMAQEADLHRREAQFLSSESNRLRALACRELQERLHDDNRWRHVAAKASERDGNRCASGTTA